VVLTISVLLKLWWRGIDQGSAPWWRKIKNKKRFCSADLWKWSTDHLTKSLKFNHPSLPKKAAETAYLSTAW